MCFGFSTFRLRRFPFICYRERGPAVPFSRRPFSGTAYTRDKVALHFLVLCEEKSHITPTFEPVTQPLEGDEVTN